jgi:hypothetical protein
MNNFGNGISDSLRKKWGKPLTSAGIGGAEPIKVSQTESNRIKVTRSRKKLPHHPRNPAGRLSPWASRGRRQKIPNDAG